VLDRGHLRALSDVTPAGDGGWLAAAFATEEAVIRPGQLLSAGNDRERRVVHGRQRMGRIG